MTDACHGNSSTAVYFVIAITTQPSSSVGLVAPSLLLYMLDDLLVIPVRVLRSFIIKECANLITHSESFLSAIRDLYFIRIIRVE